MTQTLDINAGLEHFDGLLKVRFVKEDQSVKEVTVDIYKELTALEELLKGVNGFDVYRVVRDYIELTHGVKVSVYGAMNYRKGLHDATKEANDFFSRSLASSGPMEPPTSSESTGD